MMFMLLMATERKRFNVNGHQLCNGKLEMKPDDCSRELTQISRAWDPYVTAVIVRHEGDCCCVLK